ncbi:hypothetical protein LE181_03950 [Streptomyces sp. SCA3-4]|uniref:hypothetical protein n=1 Tax=Streptomyces sichuanensis TaxID=2871810 RepID=UPI001CE356C4|nr:hypothetical protein [Streptomyces sichuanensis]MCA6091323.1 hypothetical protein [Streptomyces sichuanensis]
MSGASEAESLLEAGLHKWRASKDHSQGVEAVQRYLAPGRPPPFPWGVIELENHVRGRRLGGPYAKGEARLYILAFAGPVPYVKVGRTTNLPDRLTKLIREARVHGYSLVDGWKSPVSDRSKKWEKGLLASMPKDALDDDREYFHGADFARAVRLAEKIIEADTATIAVVDSCHPLTTPAPVR